MQSKKGKSVLQEVFIIMGAALAAIIIFCYIFG